VQAITSYHVTCRGDRREPIFEDDDQRNFLIVAGQAMERFDATVLAYGVPLHRRESFTCAPGVRSRQLAIEQLWCAYRAQAGTGMAGYDGGAWLSPGP
jgi:hypothetical protein